MLWDFSNIPADLVLWCSSGAAAFGGWDLLVKYVWFRRVGIKLYWLWSHAAMSASAGWIVSLLVIAPEGEKHPVGGISFILFSVVVIFIFINMSVTMENRFKKYVWTKDYYVGKYIQYPIIGTLMISFNVFSYSKYFNELFDNEKCEDPNYLLKISVFTIIIFFAITYSIKITIT